MESNYNFSAGQNAFYGLYSQIITLSMLGAVDKFTTKNFINAN